MKAIIFSVSAGGGHSHAAEAIKNYIMLNEPNSEVEIIDTLKYINPIIDKVVIGSYLNTIKITPSLFGKLYNFAENDDALSAVSGKIIELLANKLLPLINNFRPDVLIATHPFPTEMISVLKGKFKINMPIVSMLTDYAPHSFWIHPGIDAYIVSNDDMITEMIHRGVSIHCIYSLGIPVKPDFLQKFSKGETLKELGLSNEVPTILMMGGSLGMGKISQIYENLIESSLSFQVLIITGNNKKLFEDLNNFSQNSPKKTRVLGFSKQINRYMQSCDLLLTKPGGLTITEALICKIPLAIFSPIPGQEEKNAEFLLRHNLAINLENGKNCRQPVENLLSSPQLINSMRQNCIKYAKPNAGNDIYVLLKQLISSKKNPV